MEAERQRADVLQLRAISTGTEPDTSPEAPGSLTRNDWQRTGLGITSGPVLWVQQ